MTYSEVLANARQAMSPNCKACPVCNGRACTNHVPGPGAKGVGDNAIRNFDAWQRIRVNMDTMRAAIRTPPWSCSESTSATPSSPAPWGR